MDVTSSRNSKLWPILVFGTVCLVMMAKIFLAATTRGSNDVEYWRYFLEIIRESGGRSLYREVWYFNHPPFMITALRGFGWLSDHTSQDFPFWLRLPAILADAGSVFLIYRILRPRWTDWRGPLGLLCLAAAPVSIMISGFHGNTDPVMLFFVVLAIALIEGGAASWIAGLAFGMALNVKVVPLILMPVFLFFLWDNPKRLLLFFGVAFAIFAAASLPYIAEDPSLVFRRVFGYGSVYGHWGLTRFTGSLPATIRTAHAVYGKWVLLALIGAAAWWMNFGGRKKAPLFLQAGVGMFLFLSGTPGFGVQYLSWLVPWAVAAGLWAAMGHYTAGGAFLFVIYHYWSGGRWWYADSDGMGDWKGWAIVCEIVCWISVLIVSVSLVRRAGQELREGGDTVPVSISQRERSPVCPYPGAKRR